MPDSPQNGHSNASPPIIRPPVGVRAGRRLNADEEVEAENPIEELESEETPVAIAPEETPQSAVALPIEAPALDKETLPAYESEVEWAAPASANGGGEPPRPPLGVGGGSGASGDPNTPRDQELGLLAHLAELRTRILYCFVAVMLAMILTWNRCTDISDWFAAPIKAAIKGRGSLISTIPTGFFTIYLQVSFVSALILVMPFIIFQVWRFIEPALTNNERKYTLVLVPFSSALFFLGAGMGFMMTPMFFKFFLAFQPPGVLANWEYSEAVLLMGKTLLVFGVAFQVPVVTIFLNKTGIVSRNLLIQYWRHAVVVIFTLVAFVVPTWDPLTMTACAVPPCLLYLLSIWLVKWL